jgi:hypothetical protein
MDIFKLMPLLYLASPIDCLITIENDERPDSIRVIWHFKIKSVRSQFGLRLDREDTQIERRIDYAAHKIKRFLNGEPE